LHQRDRGEGQRADVEAPARQRHHDPERVPAGAKQRERRADRPAHVDQPRLGRAAVLVEESERRSERGGQREQQADLDGSIHQNNSADILR
jgi:hypothetical protein